MAGVMQPPPIGEWIEARFGKGDFCAVLIEAEVEPEHYRVRHLNRENGINYVRPRVWRGQLKEWRPYAKQNVN